MKQMKVISLHMNKIAAACSIASLVFQMEFAQGQVPQTPRIDSVGMSPEQPHESESAVVWYDDFDQQQRQDQYPEKSGELTDGVRFGGSGKSLEMHYSKGGRGSGGRKVFFGDTPTSRGQALRIEESFDDIYWRIYVKHPASWRGGGPAKLSRATSLVPPGWRQSMIAHVWSSGEALTLDPASGVKNGAVITTGYNDFQNLKWLGNRPASKFQLHGRDGLGWWVCVEARAKLNTPGKRDGLNQLWIDGKLEAERRNLDWRGTFAGRGINAVFLEAYWNDGSPVDQSRWIDNFVVSTKRIGSVHCPVNPTLFKMPYEGPGQQKSWQVEIAIADAQREDAWGEDEKIAAVSSGDVVWTSGLLQRPGSVNVNSEKGNFVNHCLGMSSLLEDAVYVTRVRQQSDSGAWSPWSRWHQSFRTSGNK